MSFHVYIEPELQVQLEAVCKKTGLKRNTIVREALREYVTKRLDIPWPDDVLSFEPDSSLPRFESLRKELREDRDYIFRAKIK